MVGINLWLIRDFYNDEEGLFLRKHTSRFSQKRLREIDKHEKIPLFSSMTPVKVKQAQRQEEKDSRVEKKNKEMFVLFTLFSKCSEDRDTRTSSDVDEGKVARNIDGLTPIFMSGLVPVMQIWGRIIFSVAHVFGEETSTDGYGHKSSLPNYTTTAEEWKVARDPRSIWRSGHTLRGNVSNNRIYKVLRCRNKRRRFKRCWRIRRQNRLLQRNGNVFRCEKGLARRFAYRIKTGCYRTSSDATALFGPECTHFDRIDPRTGKMNRAIDMVLVQDAFGVWSFRERGGEQVEQHIGKRLEHQNPGVPGSSFFGFVRQIMKGSRHVSASR